AYDTRLERDVAVKVLRTEHVRHEDRERSIHRFGREIEAMQRLRHPHIVPVLDYGIEDGFHYLAMEWMPGGTLRQRLGKRFDWRDVFSLVLPILAALEHAHSNGIIHRDLKPSNLLFSAENQPMLSDFGIAKVSHPQDALSLTGTNMIVGTPEYMAPEQIHGRNVDARTDVYALGVVLYEMLTGRKPFEAKSPFLVMAKITGETPPAPRSFVPDLPEPVETILLQALSKSPEERFPQMAALRVAIQNALHTSPHCKPSLAASSTVSSDEEPTFDALESVLPAALEVVCPFCHQATYVTNWHCSRCGANLQTAVLVMRRSRPGA
ncbi:MAG: serine/threonine-protein kinase, partial [Anaerolineales bacterium]|nr:serine/threonine-protein kinase [Anaerolineales bacterium]